MKNFSLKIKASDQPHITLKRRVGYLDEEVSAARSKFVRIELNEHISDENEIVQSLAGNIVNETDSEMVLDK